LRTDFASRAGRSKGSARSIPPMWDISVPRLVLGGPSRVARRASSCPPSRNFADEPTLSGEQLQRNTPPSASGSRPKRLAETIDPENQRARHSGGPAGLVEAGLGGPAEARARLELRPLSSDGMHAGWAAEPPRSNMRRDRGRASKETGRDRRSAARNGQFARRTGRSGGGDGRPRPPRRASPGGRFELSSFFCGSSRQHRERGYGCSGRTARAPAGRQQTSSRRRPA